MEELMLDSRNPQRIAKPLTRVLFSILKEYTEAKSNVQLGQLMDIKNPGAAISQMASPKVKLYLRTENLKNLARRKDITYEELVAIICEKLLVVPDENRRQAFLIGLQGVSGLASANIFHQKLNGQEAHFLQTGSVPYEWIKLVPDQDKRIRMIVDYCADPERFGLKKVEQVVEGIALPRKDLANGAGMSKPDQLDGNTESHLPSERATLFGTAKEMQLLNAISQASQNVGEAKRCKLNMCPEVLIGTLISQMLRRNYAVDIKITREMFEGGPVDGEVLHFTFQDKDGKIFLWKISPRVFLSDKVDVAKKS